MIIDISKHQGNMDFKATKSSNIEGAVLRCAYSGVKDKKFDEFASKAKAANVPFGAYAFATWHYLTKSNNLESAKAAAETEVQKVINILRDKGVTGYVALDLELENGKSTVLSKSDMTMVANLYMDKLAEAGYKPCLYCSISWLFDKMVCSEVKYPLWVAYYNDGGFISKEFPNTKYGDLMRGIRDKIVMWQFSSKGSGSTYGSDSQYIDLNHLYGEFASKVEVVETPQPITQPSTPVANTYIVQKGDTLSGIAKRNGILLSYLLRANSQISDPNLIRVGQRINIPHSQNTVTNNNRIDVGSRVKIKTGSKTFEGKSIASFVFQNTYTVDQIKGDRAVLDLKGICTPVNIKDLEVV